MIGDGENDRQTRPLDEPGADVQALCTLADEVDSVYSEDEPSRYYGEESGQDEGSWGCWDGECYACGFDGRINDMALCEECAGKLERDLIRERAWDHSAAAYGVPAEQREELRRGVVKQYGKKLELMAPTNTESKKRRKRRKKGGTSRRRENKPRCT